MTTNSTSLYFEKVNFARNQPAPRGAGHTYNTTESDTHFNSLRAAHNKRHAAQQSHNIHTDISKSEKKRP